MTTEIESFVATVGRFTGPGGLPREIVVGDTLVFPAASALVLEEGNAAHVEIDGNAANFAAPGRFVLRLTAGFVTTPCQVIAIEPAALECVHVAPEAIGVHHTLDGQRRRVLREVARWTEWDGTTAALAGVPLTSYGASPKMPTGVFSTGARYP